MRTTLMIVLLAAAAGALGGEPGGTTAGTNAAPGDSGLVALRSRLGILWD